MENEKISENIHTFLRLRPDLPEDNQGDEFYLTGSSETGSAIVEYSRDGSCTYFSSSLKREHQFKVDGFFDGHIDQDEIYETAVRPLVESVLKGFSATVFAYGPTGSGKTYTMMGDMTTSESKGIIPRVFDQLLGQRQGNENNCVISMSYLQIYCETLTDLLDPRPVSLSIRESRRNGVYVENLSEIIINSYSDVRDALSRGNKSRATAATNANSTSSRSHAAILIKVISPDGNTIGDGKGGKSVREGTLVLIDLAGSERATAISGRNYLRAEESKSINLSLSALGNCISALSSQQATDDRERAKYVPYRDSKLTRLLQGSLGGGSRTSVIVTITPGPDPSGEILNALRFASRCSSISVVAKVHRSIDYEVLYTQMLQKCDEFEQRDRGQQNEIEKQYEISEEQEQLIEHLREENSVLKRELESLREAAVLASPRKSSPSSSNSGQRNETELTAAEWAKKLEEISAQHLSELNSTRERYEQRVSAYKRSALESTQEIESLQSDLQRERERHLETLKDYRIVKERAAEMEKEYEMRIQELLSELQQQTTRAESESDLRYEGIKRELEEKKEKIRLLEERLLNLNSESDMVSRSQVEEMEAIFVDTINQLASRVMQLEEKKEHSSYLPNSYSDEEFGMREKDRSNDRLPSVPPRGVRIEPGKVRARPINGIGMNEKPVVSNPGVKITKARF